MASSEEECTTSSHSEQASSSGLPFCSADWDGEVCWPSAQANTGVELDCPLKPWFGTFKFSRECDDNGTWAEHAEYNKCMLKDNPYENLTLTQLKFFTHLSKSSRIMSIAGLSLSWVSLLIALIIFLRFRSLNCSRTKIHKHLFVSLLIRITTEVILAIDYIYSSGPDGTYNENTIRFTPILCEILDVLREYGRFSAFCWMFIEGMYLNSLISIAVFGKPRFVLYYLIGWVFPVPFVSAWAIAMVITNNNRCWWSHVTSPIFIGVIEVPRNILLIINAIFLMNIVQVLVTKLRESNSRETQLVRKAIKAALVLLPLLGIVNLLWIIGQPRPGDSRATLIIFFCIFRFFDEFQGFFVAVVYCYLNQEVQMVLRRKWSTWRNYRDLSLRRTSVLTSTSDIHSTRGTKQKMPGGGFEYITVTV